MLDVTSHLRKDDLHREGYSSQFLLNVDFNADEQMIFSSVKIRGQKYPANVYTILGSQDSLQDTNSLSCGLETLISPSHISYPQSMILD